YAALNADTYGTGFSDLAKNTGGVFAYTNLRHRWNWGASIEQTPYVAGGYAAGIDRASNTYLDQTIIQREVYRGFSGMTAYPFTPSNRVEFGAGFSQITWDQQIRTVTSSLTTGRVVSDNTTTTSLGQTLNMQSVSAAFVNDNSLFGATSPVAGQRARIEV